MAGEQRDPLDRLLDDALETYASQEPRPGIDGRVLNRIRAEGRRPRFLLLRWALPVAALGGLLAGVAIWKDRAVPEPSAPPEMVRTEAKIPSAMVPSTVSAKPLSVKRRIPHRSRMPKQAQFPVRAPLTHEERALIAFVRSAPEEALEAFGQTLPNHIEPLRIEEIELHPLQIRDGAK
jgi:hypothetical protein